jgi:hypothetical protein
MSSYGFPGRFIFSSCSFRIEKKRIFLLASPWPQSANELYLPSDRNLLATLVPTFAERGCHVVSATDPYGFILGFLLFFLITFTL